MFSTQNATTPPIGTGNYASWFVFVLIILLAVIAAEFLIGAVGLKAK